MTDNLNKANASVTVEASLVYPFFLFAFFLFLYLFPVMELQYTIQSVINETARGIGDYGCALEIVHNAADNIAGELTKTEKSGRLADIAESFGIDSILIEMLDTAYLKNKICSQLKEKKASIDCLADGLSGISCTGSRVLTQDDCIEIICSYQVRLPVKIFGAFSIPVVQKIRYRMFTGHKVASKYQTKVDEEVNDESDDAGNAKTVYITETGHVYHNSVNCPALKISTRVVFMKDIINLRNEHGAKYNACERCASGECPQTVYITDDGNRYHYSAKCSTLKRTVIEIKLSEIGNRTRCKRCGSE